MSRAAADNNNFYRMAVTKVSFNSMHCGDKHHVQTSRSDFDLGGINYSAQPSFDIGFRGPVGGVIFYPVTR